MKFSTVQGLLKHILDLEYFHDSGGDPAIPFRLLPGKGPLLVVVGDNASGKSFFRRLVQAVCKKASVECMPISAEGRRQISGMPWLSMVYGDEGHQATGVNSTNTVLAGISTCQGRTTPHVIVWDEPDLGLSENWSAGVGQRICRFAQEPPEFTRAIVVVSHSRALVRELLPANPFYLHLGVRGEAASPTLETWLDRPIVPQDPDLLKQLSLARFRRIQAILNKKKP